MDLSNAVGCEPELCDVLSKYSTGQLCSDYNCLDVEIHTRRFVQFNDLVFYGSESITSATYGSTFKVNTTEYKNKNGSYYGSIFKNGNTSVLVSEQEIDLDITLPFLMLTKQQISNYKNYIYENLTKAGKLWAIDENGQVIWCNAIPKSLSEDWTWTKKHTLKLSVQFINPEGVWHKADPRFVFLSNYVYCDFTRTLDFNPQENGLSVCDDGCCGKCTRCLAAGAGCFNQENSLLAQCNLDVYNPCETPFKFHYSCYDAEQSFGEARTWGNEFIVSCNHTFFTFNSNTVIDTNATVRLLGKFKDPVITINGTSIQFLGMYNGLLTYENGQLTYSKGCDADTESCVVPLDKIKLLDNKVDFNIQAGTNYLDFTGGCGEGLNRVFIFTNDITI